VAAEAPRIVRVFRLVCGFPRVTLTSWVSETANQAKYTKKCGFEQPCREHRSLLELRPQEPHVTSVAVLPRWDTVA
jgi:hypothetical protein